jgi:hypothetical protein
VTAKRGRGRPPLAAQNLDEALDAVYNGRAPERPRNEFERVAGAKRRGRKPNGHTKTQAAAELAAYRVQNDGLTICEAVKQAAKTYGADPSNVRRYTKRRLTGPMVEVKARVKGAAWAPLVIVNLVPVLAFMEEATDGNFTSI